MKYPEIKPENYFWLKDGRTIKNLEELSKILENIPQDVFSHHVNDSKNDFANWIRDIFRDKKLAGKLSKKKSAKEIIGCLKEKAERKRAKTVKVTKKKVVISKKIKKNKVRIKSKKKISKKINKKHRKKKIRVHKKTVKNDVEKDVKGIIDEKSTVIKKQAKDIKKPEHHCSTIGFKCSLVDFLLGILIGILIAVMLSKVI
jgi:hypothetical protein